MTKSRGSLDALLPSSLRARIDDGAGDRASATVDAVLLFADVAGWSRIAAELGSRGSAGLDELGALLGRYFSSVSATVGAHGGAVERFAGDAVLAVWTAEPGETLADAVQKAHRCGSSMSQALRDASPGAPLELHVAITAGSLTAHHVQVGDRWHYVLAGEPLRELSRLPARAAGEVHLAQSAAQVLATRAPPTREPAEAAPASDRFPRTRGRLTSVAADYVSDFVRDRLDAAPNASWVAEVRRATAVFVRLPHDGAIERERLEQQLGLVSARAAAVEGLLHDVIVDDKGLLAIAVFGVQQAHVDDAARALDFARGVVAELRARGVLAVSGIASGPVLSALLGAESRREFVIVGDTMNRAARLLALGHEREGVHCDGATLRAARQRFRSRALTTLDVKGQQIEAHEVAVSAESTEDRRRQLCGRLDELTALGELVAPRFVESPSRLGFRLAVVEGEAGIGKSALASELSKIARQSGLRVAEGKAEALHAASPYFAWQAVIADLSTRSSRPGSARDLIGELIEGDSELEAEERRDAARQAVVAFVANAAASEPLLLVLEDAHWFDSASTALVLALAAENVDIAVLLTRRPGEGDLEAMKRVDAVAALALPLGPLADDAVETLVAERLGAPRIGPRLAQLVVRRSEGHAFYAEELALSLADSGALVSEGDQVELTETGAPTELPATLEQLVVSRIDRLPEAQRTLLKVGSVLGRDFSLEALRELSPAPNDGGSVEDHVAQVERTELVRCYGRRVVFKHALVQEAAYGLLAPRLRRELHLAAAERIERRHGGQLERRLGALAHHFRMADDRPRALSYAERAAFAAQRAFANREAERFFADSLTLAREDQLAIEPLRLARWQLGMGQAQRFLGRLTVAERNLEQALRTLALPVVRRGFAGTLEVLYRVGTALLYRRNPPRPSRDVVDERSMLGLSAYTDLAVINYWNLRTEPVVNNTLACLPLLARAGWTLESALALVNIGNILALLGRIGWAAAGRYDRTARELARALTSPLAEAVVAEYASHLALIVCDIDWFEKEAAAAVELLSKHGATRFLEESLVIQGFTFMLRGNYVAARANYERVERSGRGRDDAQTTAWGVMGRARMELAMGHADRSEALARAAFATRVDRITELDTRALIAASLAEQGRHDEALKEAAQVLAMVEREPSPSWTNIGAYANLCETFALATLADAAPRRSLLGLFGRALKAYSAYTRATPVAEPRRLLYSGVLAHFRGQHKASKRAFERSLSLSRSRAVLHDETAALSWSAVCFHDQDALLLATDRLDRMGASPRAEWLRRLWKRRSSR